MDGLLRAPDTWSKIKDLAKAGVVDLPLLDNLADTARAAWFSRYRLLQVNATHTEATLPVSLVDDSFALRRRMLKTLEYNLEGDPTATAPLAAICAGSGHQDLAHDLLAASAFYRERKSDIEHDKKNYRKPDEAEARKLADWILRLLGAIITAEQTQWKDHQARAFTLLLQRYEEARHVGQVLFYYGDGERLFPSLFSAARSALGPRADRGKPDTTGNESGPVKGKTTEGA